MIRLSQRQLSWDLELLGFGFVKRLVTQHGRSQDGYWFRRLGSEVVTWRANALLLVCKKTKVLTLVSLWMDQD